MSYPVYSVRVAQGHAGSSMSYVVPAGYRFVLRFATAFNGSALLAEDFDIVEHASLITVWQVLVPPSNSAFFDGRVVFDEGTQVDFNASADIDFTASGYLLTLP